MRFFQKVGDCWFYVHCVLVTFILCVCCEVNLQQRKRLKSLFVVSIIAVMELFVISFFSPVFVFIFLPLRVHLFMGKSTAHQFIFFFLHHERHTGINAIYGRNKHCRAVPMVTLL